MSREKVVLIGDQSLANESYLPGAERGVSAWLRALLPQMDIVNLAAPGFTAKNIVAGKPISDTNPARKKPLEEADLKDAKYIVVSLGGLNDLKEFLKHSQYLTKESRVAYIRNFFNASEFENDCITLFKELRKINSTAKIILAIPYFPSESSPLETKIDLAKHEDLMSGLAEAFYLGAEALGKGKGKIVLADLNKTVNPKHASNFSREEAPSSMGGLKIAKTIAAAIIAPTDGARVFYDSSTQNTIIKPAQNTPTLKINPYANFTPKENERIENLGVGLKYSIDACQNEALQNAAKAVLAAVNTAYSHTPKQRDRVLLETAVKLTKNFIETPRSEKTKTALLNILTQYTNLIHAIEIQGSSTKAVLLALASFLILALASFCVMAAITSIGVATPLTGIVAVGLFINLISILGATTGILSSLYLGSAARDYWRGNEINPISAKTIVAEMKKVSEVIKNPAASTNSRPNEYTPLLPNSGR